MEDFRILDPDPDPYNDSTGSASLCRTGRMQVRWNTGQVGCRSVGMQNRWDAGQEEYRTGEMQDRWNAGLDRCRKGEIHERDAGQEPCCGAGAAFFWLEPVPEKKAAPALTFGNI